MKKRWILFIVSATALLFVAGVWLGTNIDLKELNNRNKIKEGINHVIAVVNQDLGITEGDSNIKYSDAFISSLTDGYKVVSYKEAQKGMENGDYAAIVTFPANMSSDVYSLNGNLLKQSKIDFVVNPSLAENAYLDTYLKIMDLQKDISNTISYLYIVSMFDEFHDAQDKIKTIFQNDENDITALNDVELHDFRLKVNWSDIPQVDFNPTEIDFDEFVATVQNYADSMSKEYTDSYAVAQADYDVFQTGFSDSADKISSEGLSWYNHVDQREEKVSEQVSSLEQYRGSLLGWSDRALLWNEANLVWNNRLSEYHDDVSKWKKNVSDWKDKTEVWGKAFQKDMDNYKSSIGNYKTAVDNYLGSMNKHYSDSDEWAENYKKYANDAKTFFEGIKELIGKYNSSASNYNTQKDNLLEYMKSADNYSKKLSTCKSNLETAIDYYNQLKTFYFGKDQTKGLLQKNNELYEKLFLFKDILDEYKTKLETYVGHKIDEDITYNSLEFDKLIPDIEKQKDEVDTYIKNNQTKFDNANKEIEKIFNNDNDTTIEPTTIEPTTIEPTTIEPSAIEPTTIELTTIEPSAIEPTTMESTAIEPSTLPDYSSLEKEDDLALIDNKKLQSFIAQDKLTEWRGEYSGNAPDAQEIVIPEEELTKLSKEKEVQDAEDFDKDLPQFEGDDFEELNITEPEKLNDQLPEVPQLLLDNCNSIISESKKYIPTNYLNDETKSKVNEIVGRYADNLTVVDSRLTANMVSNNNLLTQSYNGYNKYVYTLRSDADSAYNAQTDDLDKTLDSFYSVKKSNSKENRDLLTDFSEKLPESRVGSVTNNDYVKFTIMPLDFSSGNIRATDKTQANEQQLRLNILSISIISLLVIVIISLLVILYFYKRDRKNETVIN